MRRTLLRLLCLRLLPQQRSRPLELLLTKSCLKYALLAQTHRSLITWRAPGREMALTRIKLPERRAELEKGIGTIGLLIWPIEKQNAIVISDIKKASSACAHVCGKVEGAAWFDDSTNCFAEDSDGCRCARRTTSRGQERGRERG